MNYQCNLRACKKADKPSMSKRTPTVNAAQTAKTAHNITKLYTAEPPRPI